MDHDALARTEGPLTFIVGSGRSGTSLLAAMLDAHPELAIASESHFLPKMIETLPEQITTSRDVEHLVRRMERSKWFADWDYDVGDLSAALEADLPVARHDALRMIYRVYAAQRGKRRFGEKTPAYVYSITVLADEFDDAKFVHIVRDGRNVALSFREASFGADDLEHSMLNWQHRVLGGHRMGRALGADRYFEIVYEQLIVEPEAELRRLCGFLGLQYADEMPAYHRRKDGEWAPRDEESANLALPPTTTRDWSNQLDAREKARLELLGKRALRTWGYETTGNPTLTDRAAALRARARWMYYRFRSKTGLARRSRTVTGKKGDHVKSQRARQDG